MNPSYLLNSLPITPEPSRTCVHCGGTDGKLEQDYTDAVKPFLDRTYWTQLWRFVCKCGSLTYSRTKNDANDHETGRAAPDVPGARVGANADGGNVRPNVPAQRAHPRVQNHPKKG